MLSFEWKKRPRQCITIWSPDKVGEVSRLSSGHHKAAWFFWSSFWRRNWSRCAHTCVPGFQLMYFFFFKDFLLIYLPFHCCPLSRICWHCIFSLLHFHLQCLYFACFFHWYKIPLLPPYWTCVLQTCRHNLQISFSLSLKCLEPMMTAYVIWTWGASI